MPLISLLLLAALAGDPPPPSKPTVQAAPASAIPSTPAKPKKICVEEAALGSLMTRRICATQEEWDRRAEGDALEFSRSQNNVPSAR